MSAAAESSFGELLRRYRRATGLTQEELAEHAGLSVRGISDLERGLISAPRRDTVEALADTLKLSPSAREHFLAVARRRTCQPALRVPASLRSPVRSAATYLPLAGRSGEMAQIERLLQREGPPFLVLYGDPGIGKTRILAEAADRAQQAGWTIIQGGCMQRGGQRPYAPMLPALVRYLAGQSRADQRRSLQGCEWMVRLLPELADAALVPAPSWTVAPMQEQRLMFAAVGRYLANIASPVGVLLVLDDLQWAEPDGLDLLATLLRESVEAGRTMELRAIGAFRDLRLDAQHPLPATLLDLARAGLVERLHLGPLAPDEAEALLQLALDAGDPEPADATDELLRQVLERAGGVPLFLTSYVRELRLHTLRGEASLAGERVPWDIAEMVRQRLGALSEHVRELLAIAAIYGRTVPYQLLATVSALNESEVIGALESAVDEHLLVEASDEMYAFVHDLIREAIVAEQSAARRKALHRRIAEALETLPGPPPLEQLAFHYGRSALHEKAVFYLERLGDQAAKIRAHSAAESAYRDAIERLAHLGHEAQAAAIQERLGALLLTTGRYADALAVLSEAARTYARLGDLEGGGRVAAQMGWAHLHSGQPQQGVDQVQPFLAPEMISRFTAPTQAALWRSRAVLAFAQGQYDTQLASAQHAVALARETGNQKELAQGSRLLGLALVLLWRVDEAVEVLRETIQVAEAIDDLDSLSAALNDSAALYRTRGELELCRHYNLRALEAAERLGDPTAITFMTVRYGITCYLLGDWATARARFTQADAAVRGVEASWVAAYPPIELARLALAEGDDDMARQALSRAMQLAERTGDLQALRTARALRAEQELLNGNPAAARALLDPLFEQSRRDERDVMALVPVLAWAYLESGDADSAQALVEENIALARARGVRLVLLDALEVAVRVAMHQGRTDAALRIVAEAAALARAMACPYAEAKLAYLAARISAQRGAYLAARGYLVDALMLCDRLGERPYGRLAQTLLGTLDEAQAAPAKRGERERI